MNFLDIKTDFAFKKVFGSENSHDRLISFLNSIITFTNNAKIIDLIIIDPYNIPELMGMKDTYVDVKAVLDNGSKVIIEMQVLNHICFEKRILYNMAKNYSMQLSQGNNYQLLNPIIALTIVDFVMFKNSDKIISYFKLLEKDSFINYSDDLEMIFVELPKFDKELEQLETISDKWLYFIKNSAKLHDIPKNMPNEIESAFEVSNKAQLSAEELDLQRRKLDYVLIQRDSIEFAEKIGKEQGIEIGIEIGEKKGIEIGEKKGIEIGEKKGIEIGEKKGIEIGRLKEKQEMAQKLLATGMDIKMVESITGLAVSEFS
jgi:predicted transposase/invertase (TIGR01784 family)